MLGSVGQRASALGADFRRVKSWHQRCSCDGIGVPGRRLLCVPTTIAPFGGRRDRDRICRVVGRSKDHRRLESAGAAPVILAASDTRVTPGI